MSQSKIACSSGFLRACSCCDRHRRHSREILIWAATEALLFIGNDSWKFINTIHKLKPNDTQDSCLSWFRRRSVLVHLVVLRHSRALGLRLFNQLTGYLEQPPIMKIDIFCNMPLEKRERSFYFENIRRYYIRYHLRHSQVVKLIVTK